MVELLENVRGRDVFILQSTCAPTNDNLMEILVMVDALKRGGRQHARERLERFWRSISEAGDNIFKPGRMLVPALGANSDWSPMALWADMLSVVWSPYDNPFYKNLLAGVIAGVAAQMLAWVAWAYLAVFCSASRQQKYTAASVSWPNRPIPSASCPPAPITRAARAKAAAGNVTKAGLADIVTVVSGDAFAEGG